MYLFFLSCILFSMKGERIAQLELLLRSHPEGIRRAEIARRLGVHRSTISRYVEDLSKHIDIYEENNLIKLRGNDKESSPMELSIYESIAFNMGAEALAATPEFANPHLASALRKLAMNMRSYAPKISDNALSLADKVDSAIQRNRSAADQHNQVLEVLIDCWVSGKIARITTSLPGNEEIEIAPYFIGFKEDASGRRPITVTGRLRHTKDIITLDISSIIEALMLDETYTIPDNLKPFSHREAENYDAIDTTLVHGKPELTRMDDGSYICRFDAENSIELLLRIIQCGKSVKVLEPESYRKKLVDMLSGILSMYKST